MQQNCNHDHYFFYYIDGITTLAFFTQPKIINASPRIRCGKYRKASESNRVRREELVRGCREKVR
jgi:hypothetical protein